MMHKTVYELNWEELDELKMSYYDELQYTDDANTFLCYDAISDDAVFSIMTGSCLRKMISFAMQSRKR